MSYNPNAVNSANQSLSNLTSPTAINRSLLPASVGAEILGSISDYWGNSFINGLLGPENNYSVNIFGRQLIYPNSGLAIDYSSNGNLILAGFLRFGAYGAGVAQLDSSGNVSSTAPGTSGNVLTSNGTAWTSSPTGSLAANYQLSSSCANFSTSSTSFTPITNLSVSLTTAGEPVLIQLVNDGSGTQSLGIFMSGSNTGVIEFEVDSVNVGQMEVSNNPLNALSIFTVLTVPSSGSHTITASAKVSISGSISVYRLALLAYSLH